MTEVSTTSSGTDVQCCHCPATPCSISSCSEDVVALWMEDERFEPPSARRGESGATAALSCMPPGTRAGTARKAISAAKAAHLIGRGIAHNSARCTASQMRPPLHVVLQPLVTEPTSIERIRQVGIVIDRRKAQARRHLRG